MTREGFARTYVWSIAAIGLAITGFSAFRLSPNRIDLRFLLLAMMVVVASQIAVRFRGLADASLSPTRSFF